MIIIITIIIRHDRLPIITRNNQRSVCTNTNDCASAEPPCITGKGQHEDSRPRHTKQ